MSTRSNAAHYASSFVFMRVLLILHVSVVCVNTKVFERCELVQTLHHKHGLTLREVAIWTCIAQHSSNFKTDAYAGSLTGGTHGLFQISDEFWCSRRDKHGDCNLPCERLHDADLTDDLNCARTIYKEHQRLNGNGYQAWRAYEQFCRHDVKHYIQDCFSNPWLASTRKQLNAHASTEHDTVSAHATATSTANARTTAAFFTPPSTKSHSNSFRSSYSTHKRGKIYERCELAHELYHKHKMPMEQVPTWVCIAQHESNFDTSAVGRLNADGSADHGLFQISDLYWCSNDHHSRGKACGMHCSSLLDNDISDDVRCIKRIHGEHTGITGDGFMAWSVYDRNCRDQQYDFIASCFKDQANLQAAETNTPHIYHTNPYLKHINVSQKPTHIPQHKQQQANQNTKTPQTQKRKGKIYERCELAQELYFKHKFPMQDIATWVCIAQHESNFNTAAVGRLSGGGSADHGLFQISDLYWCTHDELGGKACNISCAQLLDSDISDDVKCVRHIYEEHTRLSGDGFTAWTVYNGRCRQQEYAQIEKCFDSSNEISKTNLFSTSTQVAHKQKNSVELAVARGKIYKVCELAQELYYERGLPLKDIPTWVCIAKHESSFNTATVGRRNEDGSADYGIFQISELYWCAQGSWQGGGACKIPCDKLLDANISDDLECAKIIHAEHTRLTGDGFTAWRVYNRSCSNEQLASVSNCFPADVVKKAHAVVGAVNAVQTSFGAASKIYKKCELAQELYFKHKMPMKEVPTWVCIAEHASRYNTGAVGRLNGDGSAYHGLFQISDRYWCAHDSLGGKACGISCQKLLDYDITDDMRCVRTIFDEHTRLSGDGFTAWTVYERNCRDQTLAEISSCFGSAELKKAQQASGVRQSEQTNYVSKVNSLNAITKTTHKQVQLNHAFVNNPFLNQFNAVKFVQSTPVPSRTTSDRPITQLLLKPSHHATKSKVHTKPDANLGPSKLYVNSEMFRTTQMKTSVTVDGYKPIQEVPNQFINSKKLYINSAAFRTTPVRTQAPLEQLAETQNTTPVPTPPTVTFIAHLTTEKVVPSKTAFLDNPFLNKFMQSHHSSSTIITNSKTHTNPEKPKTPNASYVSNAFLDIYPASATHVQNNPKQNYQSNTFLNKYNVQSLRLKLIEANIHKTTTIPTPQKNSEQHAPYQFNPVLQKFSVSMLNTANKVKQTHPATSSTVELQNGSTGHAEQNAFYETSTNTSFLDNPFLSKYMQAHHSSAALTTKPQTHTNPEAPNSSSAPYASHILLNNYPDSVTKSQAFAFKPQTKHKEHYESNPFLNKYSGQPSNLASIATDNKKLTTPAESKTLYNPFLQNVSGAPDLSAVTKASTPQMQNQQTSITPSNTLQSANYNGVSKPYVNSEIFRATPVKTQTTLEQPKPIQAAPKPYNSFSKPYVNTEMFRTTPMKTQTAVEQPHAVHEIQKNTTKPTAKTTTSQKKPTFTATTTQKPRPQQTTKQYFSTFLTTTTTNKPTTFSTVVRSPANDKTQGVTTTKRPSKTAALNQLNTQQTKSTTMSVTQNSSSTRNTPTAATKNKTSVRTTKTPYTTVKTTKYTNKEKSTGLSATTIQSTGSTAVAQSSRTTSTTTSRPINSGSAKTTTSTKRPRKTSTLRPTTTVRTSYITQKPTTEARTTKRPTTSNQNSTAQLASKIVQQQYAYTTTTRKPKTTVNLSTTQKTTVATKTTKRPTTAYQKTTTQATTKLAQQQYASKTKTKTSITTMRSANMSKSTTTTKPSTHIKTKTQNTTSSAQIQSHTATSTPRPTTTARLPQILYSVTKKPATTTHAGNKNYVFSTTKVPYTTNKQRNFTSSLKQFNKKSQTSPTTTRPSAKTTTATRAATPKPTTSSAAKKSVQQTSFFVANNFNNKPTTTLKPKATVFANTTTANPYRDDPFSHPFFTKFNEKFKALTATTTTLKPPTNNTTKYHSESRFGGESEYYQQFKHHTAGNVKTISAYAFGRNSTLAASYRR